MQVTDRDRAREMRANGMTMKAIGQALRRAHETVSGWVKDVPVERRRNATHSVETRDAARQMRRDGRSLTEIATKLGVSPPTVSRWCCDITVAGGERFAAKKWRSVHIRRDPDLRRLWDKLTRHKVPLSDRVRALDDEWRRRAASGSERGQ